MSPFFKGGFKNNNFFKDKLLGYSPPIMKEKDRKPEKRKIIIRDQPGRKEKPTVESLERLRQKAEEKGWIRKKAHS
jgi:hypothetical protein